MHNLTSKVKHPLIVIAVGGTGGHLYPALALAQDLLKKNPTLSITFLGYGLDKNYYFDKEAFSYLDITSATLSLKEIFKTPVACLRLVQGIIQSFSFFKKARPTLVVGFGSFHSFPVLAAAYFKKVPYILFESNAILGKVNRFFSKEAHLTAYQLFNLKEADKEPSFIKTKMPIPEEKLKRIPQEEAKERFGLHKECLTLLVFGGSQGARSLNELFLKALSHLKTTALTFQVIHLIGFNMDIDGVKKCYEDLAITATVKVYESEMSYAYSAADLLISRAGSNTIVEQLYYRLPAIFIPYPYLPDNHQAYNAAYVCEELKGGKSLEQKKLTPEKLALEIKKILQKEDYLQMKQSLSDSQEKVESKNLSELILETLE